MTDAILRFLGLGSTTDVLSVGEVLVILLVASFLVLAASALLAGGAVALRTRRVLRERARRVRFEKWQRVLREVLYDGVKPPDLWSLVGDDEGTEFLDFLVLFVRRLEGAERKRIVGLAEPYLHLLVGRLGDPDEGKRMRAVQTLGELGLPRFGEQVVAALDDPSPLVAMVAASTLARAETPEYAAEVLARLDRFAHWRQDFLAALVASLGAPAAPTLRDTLLERDASPRVRAVSADALAILGDPRAADAACEVLGSTDDTELRSAALRLLASVGRAEHLPPVRRLIAARELPVRLAAIRALGHFGLPEDIAPLASAAKDDPSPWVAIAAARALKDGGGDEALLALAGSEHPRSALGVQVISESRSW